MAKKVYIRQALTGGAVNALDSINGTLLADQDVALVHTSGNLSYRYELDADSAAAESSPDVIKPDVNAGDKRWILKKAYGYHVQGTDQGLDTGGPNAVVVADVKDAVTKKHSQNTDTGTDSATFQIGTSGPKLKNSSGVIEARNAADGAYAVLRGDAPVATNDLTTKAYVDGLVQGLDWQASVLSRYNPTSALPSSPSAGDRYIATATANGWTINHIYQCVTAGTWVGQIDETPNEGFTLTVEDEDIAYTYTGSAWVKFAARVGHEDLSGLLGGDTNDHQHLTTAQKNALHAQNTDSGTNGQDFAIGDGTDKDVTLTAQNADANKPKLKYNKTSNTWQYSNDGSTFVDMVGSSGWPIAAAAGTPDAITADFTPDITLSDKVVCVIIATGANTVINPTFAPDGLTAHTIVKMGGSSLVVGDIPAAGAVCLLEYNLASTRWELLNPAVSEVETAFASNAEAYAGTETAKSLSPANALYLKGKGKLNSLLHPSQSGGLRDIHRGGWNLPLNQQWGGHLMPLPDGSWGDTATGYIEVDDETATVGADTDHTWRSMSFVTSKAISLAAVHLRIKKILNPTANFSVYIYSDNAGKPNALIANGTATAQAGTLHSQNLKWERFVFSTPPSLSENTKYHICCKSSAAVDAANYWIWAIYLSGGGHYPHGNGGYGDATPTWSTSAYDYNFLIEPVAANQFLQTGGQFDCKLQGSSTLTPINQNDYLWRKMQDGSGWFDDKEGTILIRGASWTKDRTITDFMYGLDHDRMVLRCNVTTGYPQVDWYDQAGTKLTVTGTTDVSGAYHDIAIRYRCKGDGSDYLYLYVDGVSQGTPQTSKSIIMDVNWKELGTAYLLGGFGLAPTWTKANDMTKLPGADGWTYTAVHGTEASNFVVSGGKLHQQWPVDDTDNANYHIHPTLNNTNGWIVKLPNTIFKCIDTATAFGASFSIEDATKVVHIVFHSYYIEVSFDNGATGVKVQMPMGIAENNFIAIGKGSDFYLLANGRIIIDGIGLMAQASANNTITFGDRHENAGYNGEVAWGQIAYYETTAILPEFTGGSLSEFACWSGDQSALLPVIYNVGAPISVKEYCGVSGNYVRRVLRNYGAKGITNSPSTASTTPVLCAEMELFSFIEKFIVTSDGTFQNNAATNQWYYGCGVDGMFEQYGQNDAFYYAPTAYNTPVMTNRKIDMVYGLHKIEGRFYGAGTTTAYQRLRRLIIQEVE